MTNKEVKEIGTYVKSVFTDEYKYYQRRCAREKRSLRELKEALEALPKLLKVYRGINADITCLSDVEGELKARIKAFEESVTECENMRQKFGEALNIKMRKHHDNKDI